jgi:hypothetical protein
MCEDRVAGSAPAQLAEFFIRRRPIDVRRSKDYPDVNVRLRCAEDDKDEDQIFAARWR